MNNKILYSLIAATFVVGLFTAAYAGITLPMITLAGDVTISGDLTCTDCIDAADIAPNAVGSSEIVDGSITSADLSPGVGRVPIGTVLPWAGVILPKVSPLPPGFLIADGSSLLRTDFPELFKVIGTIYVRGKVVPTTFSLPDLRNTFIQGTTVNLGVTGGTAIDDPEPTATDTLSHSHSVNPPATTSGPASSSVIATISLGPPITAASKFHTHSTNIGSITSSTVSITHSVDIGPTGNEPPFLSLVMIIRAE